ncbi:MULTISPECIES: nuclear transport factor 2 family protein [unclassified Imperialibacter]|uniref:nuclear transport factor 2 family protein n=1 Tax=unclassified Imperialibacter TaxID=2629706 RepID=UPI00125B6B19|nr:MULTISPECIES: nuclear transport factor 2 family protein [unclassified Imperialibacter]CAD5250521.1 putative lumazine-binding [Imperialibacter sp. 75]CAD5286685.1 putative lumazine-binding [Imperialibacter sp. 89]VVT05716.1 putative lumazine-binding [Imperialibacter sp. EC-SDR9]
MNTNISNIMMTVFGTMVFSIAQGQETGVEEVKKTIMQFATGADYQDSIILEEVLDANFTVVMNRLFGSEGVAIMPREVYLAKIKNKEFGGDKREVTISNVTINGNTANALVSFKGSKMTFVSTLLLVLTREDKWKLVADLPNVI